MRYVGNKIRMQNLCLCKFRGHFIDVFHDMVILVVSPERVDRFHPYRKITRSDFLGRLEYFFNGAFHQYFAADPIRQSTDERQKYDDRQHDNRDQRIVSIHGAIGKIIDEKRHHDDNGNRHEQCSISENGKNSVRIFPLHFSTAL